MLFLLNVACLVENQQIPILQSLVCPDHGSNPRSTAVENEHAIYYTTDAGFFFIYMTCRIFCISKPRSSTAQIKYPKNKKVILAFNAMFILHKMFNVIFLSLYSF